MKPTSYLRGYDANISSTAAFLASGTEQIRVPGFVTPEGYELHRSNDGSEIRLIHSGYTAHCVEIRPSASSLAGIANPVEIEPWRTFYCEYQSALKGYNTRLIEWLATQFSIVIREPIRERFWEYRLSEAAVFPSLKALFWNGGQAVEFTDFHALSDAMYAKRAEGEERVFIIYGGEH